MINTFYHDALPYYGPEDGYYVEPFDPYAADEALHHRIMTNQLTHPQQGAILDDLFCSGPSAAPAKRSISKVVKR